MSVEQMNKAESASKNATASQPLSAKGQSRRTFIIASAAAGGGLLIGFALPTLLRGKSESGITGKNEQPAAESFSPNAFIRINRDSQIVLIMHKVEMGQGTYTSIPMLIAEELGVELSQVTLQHAPADDKRYADPILGSQVTGGSTSIRGAWKPLREAGATARVLLISAAAQKWNADIADCRAENGYIVLGNSDKKLRYGELVDIAATLPVPTQVELKNPKDFKLIGTPAKRLDSPDKVNGKALYGIDTRLPGMKVATVAACPILGGKLGSVDESKAMSVKGVQQVVKLDNAVAVIGDHMWAAKQGLAALQIQWDGGPNEKIGIEDIVQQLKNASENKDKNTQAVVAKSKGDFQKAYNAGAIKHEAVFEAPFLSQAAIEPMNCTVHVRKDGCDIWVGTQVPALAKAGAITITRLPPEKVQIHNHHIGGGFGRRLDVDFINQAVAISKHVNYPVKVIWTREEDMQHGIYRPYYYDRLRAALDKDGRPVAWNHRVTGSSVMARWVPQMFNNGLDPDAVEVAVDPLYVAPNMLVEYVRQEPPGIVTGWWRGVGATHNVFMIESFIDELAEKAGKDPLEYRLSLLDHAPRAKAALELAASKAGWGSELPKGNGRGISVQYAFGTYLAQVAQVEVSGGEVKVKRIDCAVDCGLMVNPDTVVAQIQGGIIFGISGALFGEITTKNGRVEQSNYDNYRVIRMNETPVIAVHLIRNGEAPGGIGEPGTSAVAPALNNAVYAATGKRIRKLPIQKSLVAA